MTELFDLWLLVNTVFWIACVIFAAHRFGARRLWNGFEEFIRGWAFVLVGVSMLARQILKWVLGV